MDELRAGHEMRIPELFFFLSLRPGHRLITSDTFEVLRPMVSCVAWAGAAPPLLLNRSSRAINLNWQS